MTILNDYHQFNGIHWETGTVRNALDYAGAIMPHSGQPPTEALIFGISGGVLFGYFVFEYEGYDPHVNIITRLSPATSRILERWSIPHQSKSTTRPDKAVKNLTDVLDRGQPAIVWADMFSMPYESNFPENYPDAYLMISLLVYGYDAAADVVHIADRARVPLTCTTGELAAARGRIGKDRHRLVTLAAPDMEKLPAAVEAGIRECIFMFTEDPGKGAANNWGLRGMQKWARLLVDEKDKKGWPKLLAPGARLYTGLLSAIRFSEIWGSGGFGSRWMYADFLDEASAILNKSVLNEAAAQFRASGDLWRGLTHILLPDDVPLLKETRELTLRREALFIEQGAASLAEQIQINTRLKAIYAECSALFPMSEAQIRDQRDTLRAQVLKIHDTEQAGVGLLQVAVG